VLVCTALDQTVTQLFQVTNDYVQPCGFRLRSRLRSIADRSGNRSQYELRLTSWTFSEVFFAILQQGNIKETFRRINESKPSSRNGIVPAFVGFSSIKNVQWLFFAFFCSFLHFLHFPYAHGFFLCSIRPNSCLNTFHQIKVHGHEGSQALCRTFRRFVETLD